MEYVSRIKCENITEEIIQKYREDGFKLVFQEYVMEHDLSAIHEVETPLSLEFRTWSTPLEEDFYQVYYQSFKDRPGFPEWSMEKWMDWISSGSTFCPDLTEIATFKNNPVGFIATDSDPDLPDTHGYIIQVGVIPEWRRKGIATILTTRCLKACRTNGKTRVALHVNENNPSAIRLYERLGFKTVRNRGTFER